jgi:voltage-gated sodium channel
MDMDIKKLGDGSIQELLSQQLIAVQRVLAFHQEITKRLGDAGLDLKGIASVPLVSMPTSQRAPASPPVSPQNLQKKGIQSLPQVPAMGKVDQKLSTDKDGVTLGQLTNASPMPLQDLKQPLLMGPGMSEREKILASSVVGKFRRVSQKRQVSPGSDAEDTGHETSRMRSVLPNPEMMKKKLLQNLSKPIPRVEDYYWKEGCAQMIARDNNFQNFMLAVILLNVIWIAVDTDLNKATILSNADPVFQIVNNLFCFAFVFEILVRFGAFRHKIDCLFDSWFVFDSVLVSLMVWETWIEVALFKIFGLSSGGGKAASILRIFRMLRLTRVARLARLLRQMPELLILIKGMVYALKSVGATLLLLTVVIYVFAVLFTQQLADDPVASKGCFENVLQAMNCLMLHSVFSEQREWLEDLREKAGDVFYAIAVLYLLVASLTVLNMLIGVLCEVISVTAKVEQEEILMQDLKGKLQKLMPHLEESRHGDNFEGGEGATIKISKERFSDLFDIDEAVHALHSVGVDVEALVDFADFIFHDKEYLELGDFMEKILQFRGTNAATVKDVVDIRMFVQRELHELQHCLQHQFKPSQHQQPSKFATAPVRALCPTEE